MPKPDWVLTLVYPQSKSTEDSMSCGMLLRMNIQKNDTRWTVNGKVFPQLGLSEISPELGKETKTGNKAEPKKNQTKEF